jgi:hypothetical protein
MMEKFLSAIEKIFSNFKIDYLPSSKALILMEIVFKSYELTEIIG